MFSVVSVILFKETGVSLYRALVLTPSSVQDPSTPEQDPGSSLYRALAPISLCRESQLSHTCSNLFNLDLTVQGHPQTCLNLFIMKHKLL